MSKVSIALRGWRFDEADVFDEGGNLRPIDEMPEDARNRIVRISQFVGDPCDACWLVHGEEHVDQANVVDVVYGEPMAELILCDDHETDFLYWFREAGGVEYAGTAEFPDRFHEWFADGGRAPEGYAGLEHVKEEPDAYADVGPVESVDDGTEDGDGGIPSVEDDLAEMDDAEADALGLDLDSLDV